MKTKYPSITYGNFKVSIEEQKDKTCVVLYERGERKNTFFVRNLNEMWEIYLTIERVAKNKFNEENLSFYKKVK